MQKWWNWLLGLALLSLLFIAIPIKITGGGESREKMQLMFNQYIEKFNKTYKPNSTEYETRFKYFVNSLEEIRRLNSLSRGPDDHRAKFGLTKLSDMSKEEYKNIHLSDEKLAKPPADYNRSWHDRHHKNLDKHDSNHPKNKLTGNEVFSRKKRAINDGVLLSVDWRLKKVITPPRSQGLCGACWAFSTVGIIEAMAAIASGKLEALSVQEIIDCARRGNMGCEGGDICLLLDWLMLTKSPLEKDSEYPLRLIDGVCKLKKNTTGVQLKSYTCDTFVGSEDKILQLLATHGPVAVAVNALTWQNYLGGVIQYHCSGAPTDLNHAVELVGYDLTATVPYYIAKNSWGPDFGLGGYVHLAVGTNVCGLANEVATVDVM